MEKRIAVVEKEKCNPVSCGDFLCIRVSPGNRMGKEVFVKGPDGKAQVNEENCTDAESVTVKKCPFSAIHMVKLPQKLTTQPVHRHGKDGFILYSLPMPVFGKTVGVLGVNGIGKSTALKILSRFLEPNLGKEKSSFQELLKYFKGSESQLFFEKLSKNQIKVSYKPQNVDAIPKKFSGRVIDLLKKADETNRLNETARLLDIEGIFENEIKNLSGGELQRVAIAAAALKKAEVYLFDEPTSFLDISQRIKASNFIRSLATPETSVVVIEHDLVFLDHMADLVHIMYGEAGAYGIVSQSKPARNAINSYLEGYLKEENVRFRKNEIKFSTRPADRNFQKEPLISWTGLDKKLGNFSLAAASGELPKKSVIGIAGPNGIGKTTFVKIIAKKESPDRGEIKGQAEVSYKPQYLSTHSNQTVETFLKTTSAIKEKLNLNPLMKKKASELSGGELQRVAIAECLSKEADLYLFDEPSAHLDAEQRLIISKILKERMEELGKTALVVEHDLVFLDYLSDRLMVFEGQPSKSGKTSGVLGMEEGMNKFLSDLEVTVRRDKESLRPRINKPESRLDQEQKASGKRYYA